ncbi:glycosyltransferase [Neobacillus sp. YIM B06451]|uniref:glycosyltransferase n=1 Tax=Neobacillus sp. YIM B06451 TaxID=3070994 RepID=UPI00293199AE|nr:glycosyltransferase [Neobacillus sp. YIM B06451]
MRIWMLPKYNVTNKYNELLSSSLEKKGVDVFHLLKKDILKIKKNDIVHIHWPHSLYQSDYKLIFILKSLLLLNFFFYLKTKKVKLVWTIHNLYPHKIKYPKLEKWIRQLIINQMDLLFANGHLLREIILKHYKINEQKLKVSLHGVYEGVYKRQGLDCREKYGIPKGKFVYLFFGTINKYKGLENLIRNFKKIQDEESILLIVGKLSDDSFHLKKEIEEAENIISDFRFIPDDEIGDIIYSADLVVLPFKEITTSGSAILALTFKKNLLAPNSPFINEYFGKLAKTYESNHEDSLYNALITAKDQQNDFKEELFNQKLAELNWDNITEEMLKEYGHIKN